MSSQVRFSRPQLHLGSPVAQNRNSQSSETSDETITRTPVLTASSSSSGDSPLASPLSAYFSGAPDSPLPKRPAFSGETHVYFEEHPEAWWSRRASVDSSSSTNPLDFRPHGLLKPRMVRRRPVYYYYLLIIGLTPEKPRDTLGAAHSAPDLQFGKHVNFHSEGSVDQENKVRLLASETRAPQLTHSQSISSLSSTREATSELPPPAQATPTGAPNELSLADNLPAGSFGLRRPSSNPCFTKRPSLDVNVTPPSPEDMHRTRRSSLPVFNRVALRQAPFAELSRAGVDPYACLNDTSRPESSVLAHCGQHSLCPPSETLTQTQCGRLALREAGVPHGSPKALAPSRPLENVPPRGPRRQTSQFFQRLVHKTFARSQTAPATPRDDPAIRTWIPARPRAARYSMSFSFARTDASLPKKDNPNPPKKSRWAVVQRFIAKPGPAAKAASNAPVQPRHIRRLSSVSFLGDAMARVDPFARTGGLGATVSDSAALGQFGYPATHAPRRLSMATGVSAHMFERFSHVVSFPSDDSAASREHTEESVSEFQTPTTDRMDPRDSDVDIAGSDHSAQDFGERPDADPKYFLGRPAMSRAERRHSSPLLGAASRSEIIIS
ncbi:hypothetical protein FRC10_001096 [Ceratobasidium sp. 414]|nr:hypothetical protein FRC10_001096 [Ceratobasidium sp. 414]